MDSQGAWLDRWLDDVVAHVAVSMAGFKAVSSPYDKEGLYGAVSESLSQTAAFLKAFSALGYQPEEVWLEGLEAALDPSLQALGSTIADAGRSGVIANMSTIGLGERSIRKGDKNDNIGSDTVRLGERSIREGDKKDSIGSDTAAREDCSSSVSIVVVLEALVAMELHPSNDFCQLLVQAILSEGGFEGG